MDQVFVELIGKPQLGIAKIITVVADNFPFTEDHAKFLKATFAIPAVRQLPLDDVPKYIIQFGPVHVEIKQQIQKEKNWFIKQYDEITDNICDEIERDVQQEAGIRSVVYINDASYLELFTKDSNGSKCVTNKFLRLVDKWKRINNYFVVILYQSSNSDVPSRLLRYLTYLSDACIKTKSLKECYYQHIWYQPIPIHKTLIPPKTQTYYYTCKIGKSYWSPDLLCFFERVQVSKNYNPKQSDINLVDGSNKVENERETLERLALESDDLPEDHTTTLPYIRAQNPEQSKIFYYPDKDDDIDEDDPDNDLNI